MHCEKVRHLNGTAGLLDVLPDRRQHLKFRLLSSKASAEDLVSAFGWTGIMDKYYEKNRN